MCGKYYVDDHTPGEIERVLGQLDGGLRGQSGHDMDKFRISAKDILPTEEAPVLKLARNGAITCCMQKWGINGPQHGQRMINARCETVTDKRIFREGILKRRIAIPAAGFYEWNAGKEKNIFTGKGQQALFFAGFYEREEDGEHFVILTTQANDSMRAVHDRMPLLLEEKDIPVWLTDDTRMGALIRKVPAELERRTEYEQLSLF